MRRGDLSSLTGAVVVAVVLALAGWYVGSFLRKTGERTVFRPPGKALLPKRIPR